MCCGSAERFVQLLPAYLVHEQISFFGLVPLSEYLP